MAKIDVSLHQWVFNQSLPLDDGLESGLRLRNRALYVPEVVGTARVANRAEDVHSLSCLVCGCPHSFINCNDNEPGANDIPWNQNNLHTPQPLSNKGELNFILATFVQWYSAHPGVSWRRAKPVWSHHLVAKQGIDSSSPSIPSQTLHPSSFMWKRANEKVQQNMNYTAQHYFWRPSNQRVAKYWLLNPKIPFGDLSHTSCQGPSPGLCGPGTASGCAGSEHLTWSVPPNVQELPGQLCELIASAFLPLQLKDVAYTPESSPWKGANNKTHYITAKIRSIKKVLCNPAWPTIKPSQLTKLDAPIHHPYFPCNLAWKPWR